MNHREQTKENSSSSTHAAKTGIAHDPRDPKTWWMAYAAQRPARMPVMAPMAEHGQHLTGVSAKKLYADAACNVNLQAALAAYYCLDAVTGVGDTYNYEAEAMGQKMIYSETAMPTIDSRSPLIQLPEDLKKIKVPNWTSAGRIPFVLDLINLIGTMGAKTGKFCAPFSLAVNLRTYPQLIKDLRKNPEFAHDLFTFLVDEILTPYLQVQKQHCDISTATAPDAWASFPNVTPELSEKWVIPYAERLFKNCSKFGVTALVAGSCDYCEERVEKFNKEILFKCFDIQKRLAFDRPVVFLGMGRWHEYPLEPVVEYVEQYKKNNIRATIMATINARLLRDGPIEMIVKIIKRFIDVLGRDHNVVILMANVPADTPSRHIHAAVAAVHTYGQMPLAEDLDTIAFKIPERESFHEYVKTMSGGSEFIF